MKRATCNNTPDLIFCSDFHLRETQPICRLDDYANVTQWEKVDFIANLQVKYNCPVLHAGDLFDHWKPSPNLLRETMVHIPDEFYTIYGQHDLPQHSLELADKCGINVLLEAGIINLLPGSHWGQDPIQSILINHFPVLVWHIFNYQGVKPWPDCTSPMAAKLLRQYPQYPIIVTGDNHKPFVESYEGRLLVNPGSIARMDADQIDHKPRVYLWYAETNTVEPVYIPIKDNVITREHIELKKERDERIEAFISQLHDSKWKVSMSFEQNLKMYEEQNKPRESVMQIVYKSINQ